MVRTLVAVLCLVALADVIEYAMGKTADSEGMLITDRVPHALTDEVGLYAGSNGGNLAIAALAHHADRLAEVAWLVAFESPIGDQQANTEFNRLPDYEPGGCDALSCPFPDGFADRLAWDESRTTTARHNAMLTVPGALSYTVGGNTVYFDDLPADGDLLPNFYFSQELSEAVRTADLFGASPKPPWLVIDAQPVAAYWESRDGALNIPTVHDTNPGLRIIHLQRVDDHAQDTDDYPHATAHMLGWHDAGHSWFRLNPDAAYVAQVLGDPNAEIPENDARALVTYPNAAAQMLSEDVSSGLDIAGVLELVDRTHFDDDSVDLEAVLFP